MSESLQSSVRPHDTFDTVYADSKNSKVQCFPTVVENRFVTGLPSLQFGSTNTITFNPDGVISDIIVSAVLSAPAVPAGGAAAGEGLGLTRGWLYQLVDRISVRYAGSSLYFFQGEQELIECLSECEDSIKRDQLLQLGGSELATPADWASENLRSASIYIKLPHNSPSAQEKPIGFDTGVLSAPVQVQITWKPLSAVLLANATTGATVTAVLASAPTAFASAQMQFKQAHLQDRSDSVGATQDLSTKALSIPLKNFMQSQFVANLPAQAGAQQINLTGFRSGSVQGIFVWGIPSSRLTDVAAKQPALYSPIKSAQLSVNGLVYFTSQGYSSQLLDLVERKCATASSTTSLAWDVPTQEYTVTPAASYWLWIPFAQGVEVLRDESMLSNGLGIANSVVNLSIDFGTNVAMTVYASYLYNCTILASGGSCDYVF